MPEISAKRLLRIDLSKKKAQEEEVPSEWLRDYIGGAGIGTKILWEEARDRKIDPLSPENKVILSTGPLTGTLWPFACTITINAKSPLSGFYGESVVEGFFAAELRQAGYDFVVIEGRSQHPVLLFIGEEIKFVDAAPLWGLDNFSARRQIQKIAKDTEIKIASIGPAGENLVKIAGIWVDFNRISICGGLGAVFGSKKLKAIAVRGRKRVPLFSASRFNELALKKNRELDGNPLVRSFRKHGTPLFLSQLNRAHLLHAKNFQMDHFVYLDEIAGPALEKKFRFKDMACSSCPVGCDKYYLVQEGQFDRTWTSALEYEHLSALGARCFIRSLPALLSIDSLCKAQGI
ncbi:MAG TPA: aldehyde ferredoxin oxidoreductase N-terminal domain-containing protein, partial [bacterium]|nr:aldehyde ferredoxin oxidoreductase N-terminal domain-containing protein [bacterium]